MEILEERNGSDTELLMFTMTLINKVNNQSGRQRTNRLRGPTQETGPAILTGVCVCVCLRLWPPSLTRTPSTM